MDHDLRESEALASAAIGYDVLYDLLPSGARSDCYKKIATAAADLATSANSKIWWVDDLANNPTGSISRRWGWRARRSKASMGRPCPGSKWRAITSAASRPSKIWSATGPGTRASAIWNTAFRGRCSTGSARYRRTGGTNDKTNLLRRLGTYILYQQAPNHTRIQVMTHGDWNWSRPAIAAILRWTAHRFRDPYAQEAARRWDNEPRATTSWLTRVEFGQDFALEWTWLMTPL